MQQSSSESEKKNQNKKGKPYSFLDSFILIIGYIRGIVETSFSSIERTFGEYTSTTRFQIGKRDVLKSLIVFLFRRMAQIE